MVCLAAAFIYIYYTPPQYTRTSQITMKYDSNGRPTTSDILVFNNIGLLNHGISFSNEKHLVNSYVVWDVIVSNLKLNYGYSSINALRKKTPLYKDNPIEVILPEGIDSTGIDNIRFKIKKEGSSLSISDFKINGTGTGTKEMTVKTGMPVPTPAGKITLLPTTGFDEWDEGTIEFTYTSKPVYIPLMQTAIMQDQTQQFSTVIETSYTDFSAKRAEDILNYIPVAYTKVWNRQKNENAAISEASIDILLDSVSKKMHATEQQISQLLSANKITVPEINALQHYQETTAYKHDAVETSIAGQITVFLIDKLKSMGNDRFEMLPLDNSIDSMAIRKQIINYNQKILDFTSLQGNAMTDNPKMQSMKEELAMMKENIINSLTLYNGQLEVKKKATEQRYNETIAKIPGLSQFEKQWCELQRNLKSEEKTALYLINKKDECNIAGSITLSPVRIIHPAYGDNVPVWPKNGLILLIALISGMIVIPVAAAIASSILDYNVKDISDFENYSFCVIGQIPQIGRIPLKEKISNLLHIEAKAIKTPKLLVKEESPFTESIKLLRSNFDKITENADGIPVTLITSFNPGSGKTFFLLNLAASIALGQKRVLIIDADIRRASMSEYIGQPRTGLTSYLAGKCTSKSVIYKNAIMQGLDIIPAGHIPSDPTELLQNGKLKELTDTLKHDYDYIFLDTPPINIIADTLEMSKVANSTLFVIRCGMLDRRMLPELEKIYRKDIYPSLYVIFNGTTLSKRK